MNSQRTVAVILVALLAVCFVGSCSVAAVSLVSSASKGLAEERAKEPPKWNKESWKKKPTALDDSPLDPGDDDADLGDTLPGPPVVKDGDDSLPPSEFVPLATASAEFSLFHAGKPKADAWKVTQKLAKSLKWSAYLETEAEDAEPPYVVFRTMDAQSDYTVISGEPLDTAWGLTDKEKDALPDAKTASVVDVVLPAGSVAKLHDFTKLMGELQKAAGGVLWDEQSQEYFSAAEWKKRRIDSWEKGIPDAQLYFTTVSAAGEGGALTLTSTGLEHFAFPELELKRIPNNSREGAQKLMNVLVQLMVEGAVKAEPGRVTLKLSAMKHKARRGAFEKGLAEGAGGEVELTLVSTGTMINPKLELTFPGGGAPSARVDAAIAAIFGSSDHVDQIEHDAELTALSKKQMGIFQAVIKKRFQKGLKPGESLLVKAPFPADSGGNEWMWVEVQKLKPDGTIIGLLANDPNDVADLRSGDEVVVVESELFDWLLKEKNGATLGNETGKVMQKRLGK